MAFRFKKTESPARAVRRVCRERIGAALDGLRQGDHPVAVHGVRKEIKKLRALFRLVRGEIGRSAYRKGAKALREAAGSLTATRDARVKLKAFERLVGRGARRFAGIETALREHGRREARRFRKNDSLAVAGRILRKTNRRIGDLKIKAAGWTAIEPGLQQSYRRGRKACELVHREPSPENFHEWRKHVKDLYIYFRLLYPALTAETGQMTGELKRLSDQLGDDHDLVLLRQFVAETCAGQVKEAEALNQLIESRRNALRAAALKLGSRLYAETPAAIGRRLGNDWNDWSGEARRK